MAFSGSSSALTSSSSSSAPTTVVVLSSEPWLRALDATNTLNVEELKSLMAHCELKIKESLSRSKAKPVSTTNPSSSSNADIGGTKRSAGVAVLDDTAGSHADKRARYNPETAMPSLEDNDGQPVRVKIEAAEGVAETEEGKEENPSVPPEDDVIAIKKETVPT